MLYAGSVTDVVRTNAEAAVWSLLELEIGVVCVCVPPLKPVVMKFIPSLLRSNREEVDLGNSVANSELSGETVVTYAHQDQNKAGNISALFDEAAKPQLKEVAHQNVNLV